MIGGGGRAERLVVRVKVKVMLSHMFISGVIVTIKSARVCFGAALLAAGVFSPLAHADLSQAILDGIATGTRVNAKIPVPLSAVPVPEPSNLYEFVADKAAAIELGKALFWDMQIGSDGVQACASCHFSAGADSRVKNQLDPSVLIQSLDLLTGTLTPQADKTFGHGTGANYRLTPTDFPHHLLQDPLRFESAVLSDTNDVVSSQGVSFSVFEDAVTGDPTDTSKVVPDPDGFQVPDSTGVLCNTRRVEPRNTPTTINAVFNVRNFWDGRAEQTFNGVNALGDRDPYAYVYKRLNGQLTPVQVSIDHGSLASQATQPPLSKFEMSADGRTWVEVGDKVTGRELMRARGKRIRLLRPLAGQAVDKTDSVLGAKSAYPRPGLRVPNYELMIRQAFKNEWWAAGQWVRINADGSREIVTSPVGDNVFSQMEMNFSLFFGLAVQLYQATLVSDQTRFDQFVANKDPADTAGVLTQDERIGFFIAHDEGRCFNCHGGPELTFASFTRIDGLTLADGTVVSKPFGLTRRRDENIIDEGFNNIGVRPTLEDLGVGGVDDYGVPLSYARLTQLGQFTNPYLEAGGETRFLGADGAFKIPGLRNVALTAPYFHNGGESTLEDVIDFYFRGGNFREFKVTGNDDTDHPVQGFDAARRNQVGISGLGVLTGPNFNQGNQAQLDAADKAKLVALMKAMTDDRVVNQSAPFDHPQLFVPNGHPGDHTVVTNNGHNEATDDFSTFLEVKATGANGGVAQPTFGQNMGLAN